MGYDPIDIGLIANDGTGSKLRAGGEQINSMFLELYNAAGGRVISSTVSDITITSDVFVDTTITVSKITKSITSKLKLSFSGMILLTGSQTGIEFELEYSIDNGLSWNNETIATHLVSDTIEANKATLSNSLIIDSPSPVNTVIVKLNGRVIVAPISGKLIGGANILEIIEFEL